MDRLLKIAILAALTTGVQVEVLAQVPVENEEHLVNQFLADRIDDRGDSWWNALGRHLTLMVDRPQDEVDEATLQNIIYFATLHGDKIKLDDAIPGLVELYRRHEDVGMRVLALAAVHAIGDRDAIDAAYSASQQDDSELVRRVAKAAALDLGGGGQ